MLPRMSEGILELGIIAGRGSYPLTLAKSARAEGVKRICALAFKGETERDIESLCDEVVWIRIGQLERLLTALSEFGVAHAVMAGQLTPTSLFRVRMDGPMLALLRDLPERNAHTIFGAVGDALRERGIALLPASEFMQSAMPGVGTLGGVEPNAEQWKDIHLGVHVAKVTSGIDIGQTVVIKEGTILAVEAFEGTDDTIRRAGELGGAGAVVVKVSKPGHDMRFDIPVIGLRTMKMLKKIKGAVLAVEAGKAIILDFDAVRAQANLPNRLLTHTTGGHVGHAAALKNEAGVHDVDTSGKNGNTHRVHTLEGPTDQMENDLQIVDHQIANDADFRAAWLRARTRGREGRQSQGLDKAWRTQMFL